MSSLQERKGAVIETPEPESRPSRNVVRLSVNLAADVIEALKSLSASQGVSVTEGIRRAIALWSLVASEIAKGHKVMIVEGEGEKAKFRELILL